jgi:YegS/Rv2252/BmrU family lipid kinase
MIKFIVNPHAGKGGTRSLWTAIQPAIDRLGIRYDSSITENPAQARSIVRDTLRQGFDRICIVGGDGTIHGVVNDIIGRRVALGIIPTGSGNDFAKMLRIPSVEAGINTLASGRRKTIDLGKIGDRYFVNIVGIGFDALVAHLVTKSKFHGPLGYFSSVLTALTGYRPPRFELKTDDQTFAGRAFSISVGNGQFHGSMFRLTPDAVIDDGILDLCIIGKVPVPKFLFNIPKAIKGTHASVREIVMLKTKRLSVESDTPFYVHCDGEVIDRPMKKLELTIIPRALEVIVP